MRGVRRALASGDRFGRLIVLRETRMVTPAHPEGYRAAVCICDCGNEVTVRTCHLFSEGHTGSCGCLHKEQLAERDSTHGLSRHPLYRTWASMISRCYNQRHKNYRHYGSRGIRVCDRWNPAVVGREAVALFISDIERWLGPRPDGMTLDRMMNDHDYPLDNLRYATQTEQLRNRRRTTKIKEAIAS
jgi:hypothetical protein